MIEQVAANLDLDKKICKSVIDWLFEQLEYEITQGKRVSITNYFSIEAKWMSWRVMYNTKFKKKMMVDAYRFVSIIPSTKLKHRIKLYDIHNKKD